MKKTFLSLIGMVALAGIAGTGSLFFHPQPLSLTKNWHSHVLELAEKHQIPVVDKSVMQQAVETMSHMIYDAREAEKHAEGHIPTAMSLPLEQFDEAFAQAAGFLLPEDPILVYCSGLECDQAVLLAIRFKEQGFSNVQLFAEGFDAWKASGGAVQ